MVRIYVEFEYLSSLLCQILTRGSVCRIHIKDCICAKCKILFEISTKSKLHKIISFQFSLSEKDETEQSCKAQRIELTDFVCLESFALKVKDKIHILIGNFIKICDIERSQ